MIQDTKSYHYSMCDGGTSGLGWKSYEMKFTDSTLLLSYGGEGMYSKFKKVGTWWEDSVSFYLKENNSPIRSYKKDTLIRLSILVNEDEREYWNDNKVTIRDSIRSKIKKEEWWIDTFTRLEKKKVLEEMEYNLGLRLLCGKEIMVGGSIKNEK